MSGEELVCEVCKNPKSIKPNEIVICDRCDLGYHQLCHNPKIPGSVLVPDVKWVCKHCFYSMSFQEKNEFIFENGDHKAVQSNNERSKSPINLGNNSKPPDCSTTMTTNTANSKSFSITKFPYKLDQLNWDEKHLTNKQDVYCYCGNNLDFYRSLLQCFHCKQWFHISCINSLEVDLLIGDQYFKFECSVCTGDKEIVQRITMKWKVAVGLTLSNLTYGSDQMYFDIKEILQYMKENEDKFKLSIGLSKLDDDELLRKIKNNLEDNKDKFICKDKKWCLNVKFPYVDPLTYSPFHENLESTFVYQKSSPENKSTNKSQLSNLQDQLTKSRVPGACRKNASNQPIKLTKTISHEPKRRHSSEDTSSNSSKNKKHRRSLLSKPETSSNSSRSSSNDHNELHLRRPYLEDPNNLKDLDYLIPPLKNFEGTNNPFYRSPNGHNNHLNSSTTKRPEYRIVNSNEANKLVLSRVSSFNENSRSSNSPLNHHSITNTLTNNSTSLLLNGNNHHSTKNGNSKLTNGHKTENLKVLAKREKDNEIEYMVECSNDKD